MSEQLDKYQLADRVVQILQDADRPLCTGEVAIAAQHPFWNVDAALETAYQQGRLAFSAGVGWTVRELEAPVAQESTDA